MPLEQLIVQSEWGRLQLVVNDVDVTFFRDIPTRIVSWSSGDPFDDANAVITFPQISTYETVGEGDLEWLEGHALVDINLVTPEGEIKTLWEGMIASIEEDVTSDTSAVTVQCIGALYQLDYYVRAPKNLGEDQARPYEQAIGDEFYPPNEFREALRTSAMVIEYPAGMDQTGWETRYSGTWEKTLTGYIQRLLADMVHNPLFEELIEEGVDPENALFEVVLDPDYPPFPWGNSYPSATLNGTFRFEFRDRLTPRIPYDGNAGAVKAAFEALPTVDEVTVTGSGTSGSPWRIEFTGSKVRHRWQPVIRLIHSDLRHNHGTTRVTRLQRGSRGQEPLIDSDDYEGSWTLLKNTGRQPVLKQRDETNVHWHVGAGAPGVEHSLQSDYSQAPNVIFGEGTDESATTWRNSTVLMDRDTGETETNYYPLAWDERTWPARKGVSEAGEPTDPPPAEYSPENVRVEHMQRYGSGVSLLDAFRSSQQQLEKEKDPGWFGRITLNSDPEEGSRFEVKAGENIRLRYFRGHVPRDEDDLDPPEDEQGIVLHVAKVQCDFESGSVELTVDSKFRDLATLAGLIERLKSERKDPAKTLMANRSSGTTDDTKFPWDYAAGSGSLPKDAFATRVSTMPVGSPNANPNFFVYVNGANGDPWKRWTIEPMVAAGKGSVSRAEVRAYTAGGAPLAIPFHVGVYSMYVTELSMPKYPFEEGAWLQPAESKDALTGYDPFAVVLWGQGGQRAGYWPGLESEGNPVTGILIDEGTWQFQVPEGENVLWVAIYAEVNAYFQGRFFHGVQ